MNDDSLLPPNATPAERALSSSISRLSDVPVMVRQSHSADDCPSELLPWLAWAKSVDEWDSSWTDEEKRRVIKESPMVHKKKGTVGAIERALKPFGYDVKITQWFEEIPKGERFTFKVFIGTDNRPVTPEIYPKLTRLINANKNVRSHMAKLTVSADIYGKTHIASATMTGSIMTVYPYQNTEITSVGQLHIAAGVQIVNTIQVRPKA